jgi:ankyrin repeat protein
MLMMNFLQRLLPFLGLFLVACGGCASPTAEQLIRADDTNGLVKLIDSGQSINKRDAAGYTALHWAAYCGNLGCAQILVQRGANLEAVENGGLTPLMVAVCYSAPQVGLDGQGMVADMLLANGARINAVDHMGWSALDYAASNGNVALASTLITYGADVYLRNNAGQTPLGVARYYRAWGVVNLFLSRGAARQ